MIELTVDPALLEALSRAGVELPTRDVRKLARWALERGGVEPDTGAPSRESRALFQQAIEARAQRKPVSKIMGQRDFWKHSFIVTEDVLDPRPDTETLVEFALRAPFESVLDLGTGSGCILVSLLAERKVARGLGCDLSAKALDVARQNAEMAGVADRVQWDTSDWFENVQGRFDLIVSNPPYIALSEMPDLMAEVREYDPRMALTDEEDGLAAYRCIAAAAPDYLKAGGRIAVEIGPTQADAVSGYFADSGLQDIEVIPDLDGRDRVVAAKAAKPLSNP